MYYRVDRKERARLKNVKFTGRTTSNVDKVSIRLLTQQLFLKGRNTRREQEIINKCEKQDSDLNSILNFFTINQLVSLILIPE